MGTYIKVSKNSSIHTILTEHYKCYEFLPIYFKVPKLQSIQYTIQDHQSSDMSGHGNPCFLLEMLQLSSKAVGARTAATASAVPVFRP